LTKKKGAKGMSGGEERGERVSRQKRITAPKTNPQKGSKTDHHVSVPTVKRHDYLGFERERTLVIQNFF
jgi:hypothetical protein